MHPFGRPLERTLLLALGDACAADRPDVAEHVLRAIEALEPDAARCGALASAYRIIAGGEWASLRPTARHHGKCSKADPS